MKSQCGKRSNVICLSKINSITRIPRPPPTHPYDNDDCDDDDDCKEMEIVQSLNQSTQSIDYLIHDAGFLLLDCCTWMPLVKIGGYEGVVQVFDYRVRQVVLQQRIGHQLFSLSFHPSGEVLLLSTKTSVRLYLVPP